MNSQQLRLHLARAARQTLGLASYAAGSLVGSRYARLLGLRAAAELALSAGAVDDAERLGREILELAEDYRDDWYFGNAVHNGHQILGLARLRRGDVRGAEEELMESGRGPGSPQLNAFGPNLVLAQELLLQDRRDSVLEYLELCRAFWCPDPSPLNAERLDGWIEEIRGGAMPDFGPNLVY